MTRKSKASMKTWNRRWISACGGRHYPEDYVFSVCQLRGIPARLNLDSTLNGTCDFVSRENLIIDDAELHRCWSNRGRQITAGMLTWSQDEIKPDSRLLLFSGSSSGMANDFLNFACFILQVSNRHRVNCFRSDDRCLVLLLDPECLLCTFFCLLHSLTILLIMSGDVESNSGPKTITERMLTELLEVQTRISKDLVSLTAKIGAFEDRISKIEVWASATAKIDHRVHTLEETVDDLRKAIKLLDRKNDNLENRSHWNNLIIYGLPEPSAEFPEQLLADVLKLFSTKLKIECTCVEPCHRLVAKKKKGKVRPIIFKLLDFRVKTSILRSAFKLKGSDTHISEDFSFCVHQTCKALWDNSVELRKKVNEVRLSFDTLIVDSVRYSWDDTRKSLIKTSSYIPTSSTE
ncbi:uncharacterized protein LOC142560910 isoform X1 [Dermacentor variabilis]|uniref:uncharacterized protein LOC142560910 isoform X1 n=1 Tax=Dermacentor variabilis TaxID=34621 RepID=UPI003F5C9D3F